MVTTGAVASAVMCYFFAFVSGNRAELVLKNTLYKGIYISAKKSILEHKPNQTIKSILF